MVPWEWWNRLAEGELWRLMEEKEHVPFFGKKFADLEILILVINFWFCLDLLRLLFADALSCVLLLTFVKRQNLIFCQIAFST
jgi:hypothetical protein